MHGFLHGAGFLRLRVCGPGEWGPGKDLLVFPSHLSAALVAPWLLTESPRGQPAALQRVPLVTEKQVGRG